MLWYETFDREIKAKLPDLTVLREEPMARHTTFRVGGPVRRMAFPADLEEMTALLELAQQWPSAVVGNGSNLLAADEGADLLVINTSRLEGIARIGEDTVEALAGDSLARIAVFAQRQALAGFAFAHGIPGTLGGAVYMNAGAYGGEMRQVVRRVDAWFPGRGVVRLMPEQLQFGYRRSVFSGGDGVVLSAQLGLAPGDGQQILAEMEELAARRRSKQPLEYPSAGSTFKRPEGHFAGTLIEQCGLKGLQVGGARVSEKHAGFIINAGGATCRDILALIDQVRETVERETGVRLEPEVRLLQSRA